MSEVNLLAVVVAAIASMALGAVWYSPSVFGKKWMQATGITMEKIQESHKEMWKMYLAAFVSTLVMSWVLARFMVGTEAMWEALRIGFGLWLGFIATVTASNVIWGVKSKVLWKLENAYYLISLLMMSAILFAMSSV